MNQLIFLKENNQVCEFVSQPLVYVGWILVLGLMLSHIFWLYSLLIFFIHELNPFKEGEKATFTSESHALLYFDQLILLAK